MPSVATAAPTHGVPGDSSAPRKPASENIGPGIACAAA